MRCDLPPSPIMFGLSSTDVKGVSCVQDTVTGFLLAGVGNVDVRKKCNYLIVDSSALSLTGPVFMFWLSSLHCAVQFKHQA